jgi:hypothetical protein
MKTESFKVSVIIYPEHGPEGQRVWIAQCLEYDIMSEGKTIEQVQDRLARNLTATLGVCEGEGRRAFEGIPPAPQNFWQMFEQATVSVSREERPMRFPMPLPNVLPIMKLIENYIAA